MISISQKELRDLFWFHEDSGVLYRRKSFSNNTLPWSRAGYVQAQRNRWKVKIRSKEYMLHNIIWIYMMGEIPKGMFVDHIDRDEGNNRFSNLRLVNRVLNCQNRIYKNSSNDYVGVYSSYGKWVARITINKKIKHLGFFENKIDAINARRKAAEECDQLHLVEKVCTK